jgi:hypothetical protein
VRAARFSADLCRLLTDRQSFEFFFGMHHDFDPRLNA